nr:MAG TPA: hypothetical protein [Caudoviricetes sp.]
MIFYPPTHYIRIELHHFFNACNAFFIHICLQMFQISGNIRIF